MARRARSLDVLLAEVNSYAPKRSKASDGWLGDPAHASRASRHNPNNAGVVCAQDITHDPAGGCDIHAIARQIVQQGPPVDCEYIISNRQVAKRTNGWAWVAYTGSNGHTQHAHFAVGRGPESEPTQPYDDTDPWGVAPEEDDMPTAAEIAAEVWKFPIDLSNGEKQPMWAVQRFIQQDAHNAAVGCAQILANQDPAKFAELLAAELEGVTVEQMEQAVRNVFADAAED